MLKPLVLTAALVAALALSASTTRAEDRSPRIVINPGALICDTREQVEETIETFPIVAEGCGRLTRQVFVEFVPLEPFEHINRRYRMVEFHFPMQTAQGIEWWIQYGFYGAPEPIYARPNADL